MNNRWWFSLICLLAAACRPASAPEPSATNLEEVDLGPSGKTTSTVPRLLSETGLFTGILRELKPGAEVFAYEVNAPLFSDYAFKARFIRIPKGSTLHYGGHDLPVFPAGTTLIKNFYYPADFRKPDDARRLLETRLLVLGENGWKAFTYVWNEEQTDARLEIAGAQRKTSWVHFDGKQRTADYLVPNQNQCKNCHQRGQDLMPIGFTARQLNRMVGGENQLERFVRLGLLTELPQGEIPKLADYTDHSESTERRARAWLESNCAHCHRPDGPAKTSGLHLLADVQEPLHLGIGKAPVAAGKGSGGFSFDIVPGQPERSILVHRIKSTDPGVMMPELGRTLIHEEGLELVEAWIRDMKKSP